MSCPMPQWSFLGSGLLRLMVDSHGTLRAIFLAEPEVWPQVKQTSQKVSHVTQLGRPACYVWLIGGMKSILPSYMGVSKNRGFSPKWMVKIMENPINPWMIWGKTHYFRKHSYREMKSYPVILGEVSYAHEIRIPFIHHFNFFLVPVMSGFNVGTLLMFWISYSHTESLGKMIRITLFHGWSTYPPPNVPPCKKIMI